MKKIISILACLFITLQLSAQSSNEIEMATALRSSGKIYVVIAVICVMFLGIAAYLFSIDKKVRKIEKRENL